MISEIMICKHCKYYCQYYYKINLKFFEAEAGNCLRKTSKLIKSNKTCEFWSERNIKEIDKIEGIENTIEQMSKKLSEISEIINEYKK